MLNNSHIENTVLAWQETVLLPTYETGAPEKNPIFLEKRVYQGSSGAVYPHAVIEKIENHKADKAYTALFLENAYLKIMILPELGGRIHRAYDKIRKRDFVYHNQVIKPALVGLTGPWISGGIEFNWPQHHRPSTYLPVDFTIKENADGSKTVWINEVELMFRTKCQAGFTLYPDKAFLEVQGKLFNRSSLPQTFLWWANPAVKVNDHYQSVFPPDVHAVFDHGKRDVSGFPIAKGTYYKMDYAPGTDISKYKNIKVPTSYMAIRSSYDFVGGYEHDTQAGVLHIANHHISPGKKQWTWGCGNFGKAWDNNLTDEDGPYIELMAGVFTDNQPDFSWLQPNEEKTFEQYFIPYCKVGLVKNATKEAMINVVVNGKTVSVTVYATAVYRGCKINIYTNVEELIRSFSVDLSPSEAFESTFETNVFFQPHEIKAEVIAADQKCLVDYVAVEARESKPIPDAAMPAKKPAEIDSIEALYLNGLHIEQYRHATYHAIDYYEEALRREPDDSRCNNAKGLWLLRYGQFRKAETCFRKAIKTLTSRNPNPYDGEAYYNLGLACYYQDKTSEAYQAFYKATWNDAWQHNGFLQLARIECKRYNYQEALHLIDKSLVKNYHSHSARHLKTMILRKLKRHEEALDCVADSLKIDPFNYGCGFEHYLLLRGNALELKANEQLQTLGALMRNAVNNYVEYAFDCANAGAYEEAISLLEVCLVHCQDTNPMVYYNLGYFSAKAGNISAAKMYAQKAYNCKADHCFPNKLEEIIVLQYAISANPADGKAFYYLGNLWYGMRQYAEAIHAFENSAIINAAFPTVHRNLSLLYFNKLHQPGKSLKAMETAFHLDKTDARVLMELDQLYKSLNYPLSKRLGILEQYDDIVMQRDDLYLEKIILTNSLGDHSAGLQMLGERIFHPWEGGEGKTVEQYITCHLQLAKKAIYEEDFHTALALLESTVAYPKNLGEGKLPGTRENEIHYLLGCVYEGLNREGQAGEMFLLASTGDTEPVQAIFYNDPQPHQIFYQGLSFLKLKQVQKANGIFERLVAYGNEHMDDMVEIDYFAVSLPDLLVFDADLDKRNKIHCHYLIGLGTAGLKDFDIAIVHLNKVLRLDGSHSGAIIHLNMIHSLMAQSAPGFFESHNSNIS